jgi:predicted transcriptional regulator
MHLPAASRAELAEKMMTSLDFSEGSEVSKELHIMTAVRRGRTDVAAGRTESHTEVQRSLESWVSASNSK